MVYKWKLDKDIKLSQELLDKIKPNSRLDLDVSLAKELTSGKLSLFRSNLWKLISVLRSRKISVNCNDIRMQSIRQNLLLLGPQIIHLNISNKCNYRCSFCILHSPFTVNIDSDEFIPFKKIKYFVDEVYMLGTESIFICGEGEPLLHPQILDIISYIGKKGLRITILTNGSRGDILSGIARLSLPKENLSFVVNFCASNPDKFTLIYRRPRSLFSSLLKNIKEINKHYPVVLSYLIFKDNSGDIFDFIKLAFSLNVKAIKFKFPTLYGSEQKQQLLLDDRGLNILLRKITEIEKFSKKHNIIPEFRKYIIDYYLQRAGKVKVSKCYNGWFFSKIKLDGEAYICCRENKSLGKTDFSDFKEVFFRPSTLSYFLEGKKGINVNSRNWRKCASCTECTSNININRLAKC
jgi:MoaA/NifB/PqqE/SkfB family radical SAM enzyme